jgi:alpha-beta hydrolase superfamily lysophospholipase
VSTIDLRGHGGSGGACTLGNLEALDVAAATAAVRSHTSRPLIVVGFSMGAAAVIRSAALHEPADGVVAVSSPASWRGSRRRSARRTAAVWTVPGGTALLGALTRVRLEPKLEESASPADVVARIAPSPLLIVHGTADRFFPPEEAERLFTRASEPKQLWMIPGGGHAEGLFTAIGRPVVRARVDRFADALVARLEALAAR